MESKKLKRRRDLARLPIEEKLKILVSMQKLAREIFIATGRKPGRVWARVK